MGETRLRPLTPAMKLKPSPPVVGLRRPGFNFFVFNLYIVNMDASKKQAAGFQGICF